MPRVCRSRACSAAARSAVAAFLVDLGSILHGLLSGGRSLFGGIVLILVISSKLLRARPSSWHRSWLPIRPTSAEIIEEAALGGGRAAAVAPGTRTAPWRGIRAFAARCRRAARRQAVPGCLRRRQLPAPQQTTMPQAANGGQCPRTLRLTKFRHGNVSWLTCHAGHLSGAHLSRRASVSAHRQMDRQKRPTRHAPPGLAEQ